ncbi:hypothetical protein C266_25695 [Pandoraea sp. SD6-2]|nr:hypothetical protein C266_25695 [Pandoraea sp. SD6-2]
MAQPVTAPGFPVSVSLCQQQRHQFLDVFLGMTKRDHLLEALMPLIAPNQGNMGFPQYVQVGHKTGAVAQRLVVARIRGRCLGHVQIL